MVQVTKTVLKAQRIAILALRRKALLVIILMSLIVFKNKAFIDVNDPKSAVVDRLICDNISLLL